MSKEVDFDDVSLEPTFQVEEGIEPTIVATDPIPEPTEPVKTEPKKRGPKPKDATPGTTVDTPSTDPIEGSDPEPEPEPNPAGEEENFIQTMAKKIGIEIPEGMEFEDSEDGLVEFNQYVADQIADQKLNGYFEALPPIAGDFFDYLQMLGEDATDENIKAFFTSVNPEIDYKSVDLEKEDVQKAVMKTFFKKMDYTDDEIKDAIDDLEIAGTLGKQSKVAATKLGSLQEKERATLLAQEKTAADARKANTAKFFGNVKQVIDSGKVNNFTIPATERKALFDYDTSGQFGKDLNEALQDPARRTELAFALKNKFGLNKYITQAATTQKANGLRDKISKSNGSLKGGTGYNSVVNSDVDWDAVQQ